MTTGAGTSSEARAPRSADACPLCGAPGVTPHHRDAAREYLRCPACALIHVPARHHLTAAQEKQRYDLHRNDPHDAGYRRFLARLFEPLAARLAPGAAGLDYGCGPGPALAMMFEEAGFPMRVYDPYYAPDRGALAREYDFLSCTEAAEHFSNPDAEWRRIVSLVRPGGWIGLMTGLYDEAPAFAGWYYKNDPTHVCFYARRTLEWLARGHRLTPHFLSGAVVLLQRS
ncbi:MAG: class I SAM-dependent methyltransferase [Gammaproteobacteria bacterium]|nr:class I SAM-dependent methyltransferase [Gammaproteobacteria bacterium]